MQTDYHGGEAKYRDMRTGYHGGKAKYRDMRTYYHGSEAKYRDMRIGFSPVRDLRDLKDFNDLKNLILQARPFGLKAQKHPAQGKANNVSRHPGWTMPRMVRPTGAKAKKHQTQRHHGFCSFRAHFLLHFNPGRRSYGTCPGLCALCPVGAPTPQSHHTDHPDGSKTL